MKKVIHPGITLNELFKERDISQREFASIIDIAHSHLSDILNGKKPINASIAISLQAAGFKNAEYWMQEQIKFTIQEMLGDEKVVAKTDAIKDWNKYIDLIPVKFFKQHNLIGEDNRKNVALINDLYGVNNFDELKSRINKFSPARYRKSSAFKEVKSNLLAWEVLAKSKARDVKVINKFKKSFKNDLLSELNAIFYKNIDTLSKTKKVLSKYGVRFSTLDRPPQTPVDGKTFMVDGEPAICLTLKYKRLDNFAFTVMHELGHVFLHLTESDKYHEFYSDFRPLDMVKEESEADRFATEALIPQAEWEQFYYNYDFTDASIKRFARKLKIHPAIIRGRVCHHHNEYYRRRSSINKDNTRT
ncbi:MAG: ImmA/IrrE family metallo-endopeptidase [bacterium]|nr:ImmA/IrrE family metallo-endopeptidase [bacterium]